MANEKLLRSWHRCPKCQARVYTLPDTYCTCDHEDPVTMEKIVNPPPEPANPDFSPPMKPKKKAAEVGGHSQPGQP